MLGRQSRRQPAADACPYRRPFSSDFDACPTFQASLQLLANSRGEPLGPVWTCLHLHAGTRDGKAFYGRCALGTAADREALAAASGRKDHTVG